MVVFTNNMVIELGERLRKSESLNEACQIVMEYANIPDIKPTWRMMLLRINDIFSSSRAFIPFKIFTIGNAKLPFYSYSELSLATCPGKGICSEYCYSKRGWRYASVVGRQIQNMLLMRFSSEKIFREFRKLPKNITLRLYVDGDFASSKIVGKWFNELSNRPDIQAYGYSKSFDELYENKETWPMNYKLNLSNNGIIRQVNRETIASLPGVRGEFMAVKIDKDLMNKSKRYSLDYHMAVRQAIKETTGQAGFSCPGLCGNCDVKNTHACNSSVLKSIPIAIGIH